MKLKTIAEFHRLHREMWDWLASNPTAEKRDWPRWRENGGGIDKVSCYCFACAESIQNNKVGGCEKCGCMFTWTNKSISMILPLCSSIDSPYCMWRNTNNIYGRIILATQIRDLPLSDRAKGLMKEQEGEKNDKVALKAYIVCNSEQSWYKYIQRAASAKDAMDRILCKYPELIPAPNKKIKVLEISHITIFERKETFELLIDFPT